MATSFFSGIRFPLSLRVRLLVISAMTIVATLVVANSVLTQLFERHVTTQFQSTLRITLDQLTVALSMDGVPHRLVLREPAGDPRWTKPYSGVYWQINAPGAVMVSGVQRSRSLWDYTLSPPSDVLADGAVHIHVMDGPNQQRVMAMERTVTLGDGSERVSVRLIVAADTEDLYLAMDAFNHSVIQYLLVLAAVLGAVLLLQLTVGLAPLKALNRALQKLRNGDAECLEGTFPSEMQPLADNFNTILSEHRRHVERARTLVGNLAHAVRTPLAVMTNAAEDQAIQIKSLRETIQTHGALAETQISWHLRRARMAASAVPHGQSVEVCPVVHGIVAVMQRAYGDKGLVLTVAVPTKGVRFRGEAQDLQEILGNVIDNACKWARQRVVISSLQTPEGTVMLIDDDGPGVPPEQHSAILRRGVRMDEVVPGSGLGLAIVSELVTLYGGSITFSTAGLGGLSVRLKLPLETLRADEK